MSEAPELKHSTAPVSVVVPCYRCAATIRRAVASVAAQSLRPAQLILVDDASADDTLRVLRALRQEWGEWLQVIALPRNGGAAAARNAGWNAATQPFVAFLDADDAWHRRKIELQYRFMRAHPEVALSGHRCVQLPSDASGMADQEVAIAGVTAIGWLGLLLKNPFVTPSVMVRRDIDQRFDAASRHMEDHRLWLDVAAASSSMVRLEAPLVALFKPPYGSSGLSAQLWKMEQAELGNYRHLRAQGHLGTVACASLQVYSLLKYAKRLMRVALARRR